MTRHDHRNRLPSRLGVATRVLAFRSRIGIRHQDFSGPVICKHK
jgi:hypothetical protein